MNNCNKVYLDSLKVDKLKQQLLICSSDYQHLDFLNFYYINTNKNLIVTSIMIFITILFSFTILKITSEKYLAPVISNICYRFRIPQTIAAISLIALANGAPDIINAFVSSDDKQGSDIIMGSLLGAFIFSSTLVVANVIHQAPDEIKLHEFSLKKEIFTYGLTLFVIIGFGIYGEINYFLPLFLGFIYLFYLYISIKQSESFDVVDDGVKHVGSVDDETLENDFELHIHTQDKKTYLYKDETDIIEDKKNIKQNTQDSFNQKNFENDIEIDFIQDFIWNKNQNVLLNLIELPINMVTFFCIPHFEFYFDENILDMIQKVMLIVSCFFSCLISLLFLFKQDILLSLFISLTVVFMLLLIMLIGYYKRLRLIISQTFSLFSSITFLQLGASSILDCIQFISFQTDLNKIFLSMIIISCGNSIGDFFGNGALSKLGNSLMGYQACFSGQLFNLLSVKLISLIYLDLTMDLKKKIIQ